MLLLVSGFVGCRERGPVGPEPAVDRQPGQTVRVLLLSDARACEVMFKSGYDVRVEAGLDRPRGREKRFETGDGAIGIALSGGKITVGSEPFEGDQMSIIPHEGNTFGLGGADYRGTLRLVLNEDSESFDVINYVGIESYLCGVVGAEMPNYWEPEALKAQAIAARTYCLYIKKRFGPGRNWDLSKSQAHQVYNGVGAESAAIRGAVYQTKGKVLVCKQDNGDEEVFPCYYSSACGGHTENSEHVFGDSFAPLVGVPCLNCIEVVRPRYYFWPTARFDKEEVSEKLLLRYPKLRQLGKITDITAKEQTDYGTCRRNTRIKLSGPADKSDSIRAEDLRLTVDPSGRILRSTMCEISSSGAEWVFSFGRGFGHGVGMCQCGAQAMARGGKKAEQILEYYYPGSKIVGSW